MVLVEFWKISKYTSTCETKISIVHLATLHEPQRSSGFRRNKSLSEYCAKDRVVTGVNYIKMRSLKSRIFSGLYKDMGAVHSSLLCHCESR
ncbi:hypothetical protein TNCT_139821 [Trichonephila clavata]|uniref:Uncharacterized protein n=1 Tax=Trichonephila clavata TaxID=2740835 RepID=A0A8X6GZX8_TRICU|nr:hypothetical protein TNCT_139821 [Trichonephila clavata]